MIYSYVLEILEQFYHLSNFLGRTLLTIIGFVLWWPDLPKKQTRPTVLVCPTNLTVQQKWYKSKEHTSLHTFFSLSPKFSNLSPSFFPLSWNNKRQQREDQDMNARHNYILYQTEYVYTYFCAAEKLVKSCSDLLRTLEFWREVSVERQLHARTNTCMTSRTRA